MYVCVCTKYVCDLVRLSVLARGIDVHEVGDDDVCGIGRGEGGWGMG